MEKTYWMDKLKDIYSFMNFLKDIDSYKTFDKVSYDFSNGTGDFEKFLIKQNISFFDLDSLEKLFKIDNNNNIDNKVIIEDSTLISEADNENNETEKKFI